MGIFLHDFITLSNHLLKEYLLNNVKKNYAAYYMSIL